MAEVLPVVFERVLMGWEDSLCFMQDRMRSAER